MIKGSYIDDYFDSDYNNMPGLKNIEQLLIKIRYYDKNQYYDGSKYLSI